MILTTLEEIKNMRWDCNIQFKCDGCDVLYQKTKRQYLSYKKIRKKTLYGDNHNQIKSRKNFSTYNKNFCTIECKNSYNKINSIKEFKCKLCNKIFSGFIKQNPIYCGHSCAAIYNNTHKTKGFRRSKLETYIQDKLIELYPNINFKFNYRKLINLELDIYIPELKLAFELNGIYHYKPIYGIKKFFKIIDNDNKKLKVCSEKEICLHVIDASKQVRFEEKTSIEYLNTIQNIINEKLNPHQF